MKTVLRIGLTAALCAALFVPAGAGALEQCGGLAAAQSGACVSKDEVRAVIIRLVRGPITVIVETPTLGASSSQSCVKVFGPRLFSVSCFVPFGTSLDESLRESWIKGSFRHPVFGRMVVDLRSTATNAPPRLYTGDMRQTAGVLCSAASAHGQLKMARDATATGFVSFERRLGRFTATQAAPAPASHRSMQTVVAGGAAQDPCRAGRAPNFSLYRLLTCFEPACLGAERGALVDVRTRSARVLLMAIHEDGTTSADERTPGVHPEAGLDCVAVRPFRVTRTFAGYSWCEPGLLKASVDRALRSATMKATVPLPEFGRMHVDLSFAPAEDAADRFRPTGSVSVTCWGAHGYSETPLRDATASAAGVVRGDRLGEARASTARPFRGLLWSRAYTVQFMRNRLVPDAPNAC